MSIMRGVFENYFVYLFALCFELFGAIWSQIFIPSLASKECVLFSLQSSRMIFDNRPPFSMIEYRMGVSLF